MKYFATVLLSVGITLLIIVAVWEFTPYIDEAIAANTEKSPITITTKDTYTHNIYRLNISATCLQNQNVGNEWYVGYSIDGKSISDGEQISVPIDVEEIVVDVQIYEKDKNADFSEKSIDLNLTDAGPTKTQLIVAENGGRYRGKTATWEVSASATLIKSSE